MHRLTVHPLVAFASLLCCSAAQAGEPAINALWNDGGGFGIWLYGRPGSCSQFDYKNPPFVVVGKGGKRSEVKNGTLTVRDLEVCMLVGKPEIAVCNAGSIRIEYVPSTNVYVGEYDFKLSDNTKWSGPFRAEYCKSR